MTKYITIHHSLIICYLLSIVVLFNHFANTHEKKCSEWQENNKINRNNCPITQLIIYTNNNKNKIGIILYFNYIEKCKIYVTELMEGSVYIHTYTFRFIYTNSLTTLYYTATLSYGQDRSSNIPQGKHTLPGNYMIFIFY